MIGSIGNDFYMAKLANKMVSPFPFTLFQTFFAIISIASNFVFSKWIQWILSLSFCLPLCLYRKNTLRSFGVRKNYFVTHYRVLSFLLVYPLLFDKFLATETRILLYIRAR